jgi:hypothetical protein
MRSSKLLSNCGYYASNGSERSGGIQPASPNTFSTSALRGVPMISSPNIFPSMENFGMPEPRHRHPLFLPLVFSFIIHSSIDYRFHQTLQPEKVEHTAQRQKQDEGSPQSVIPEVLRQKE